MGMNENHQFTRGKRKVVAIDIVTQAFENPWARPSLHRRFAGVAALIKCGEDLGFQGWVDSVRTLFRNV